MEDFYQSYRQRFIVTADDFGINSRANRNILYLIGLGKIDRVAVMIGGEMSSSEIDVLVRSGAKIDIHLDIFYAFNEEYKKNSGALARVGGFLWKIISGKASPKKVEAHWRSQIEKFIQLIGKRPDGINSHEHVHFFPPFFKIALKLENEYSIPYLRFGDSLSIPHHSLISQIVHWLRVADKKACGTLACVSSNHLVSLDWIKDVETFMKNPPEGITEIVCHPEIAEDFVKVKKYF